MQTMQTRTTIARSPSDEHIEMWGIYHLSPPTNTFANKKSLIPHLGVVRALVRASVSSPQARQDTNRHRERGRTRIVTAPSARTDAADAPLGLSPTPRCWTPPLGLNGAAPQRPLSRAERPHWSSGSRDQFVDAGHELRRFTRPEQDGRQH
jgi:hypothetical protein